MSRKINQLNRQRKSERKQRMASLECVRAFQADARAVIPRRVLVDDTAVTTWEDLPTDKSARIATLAPTAAKRTRIVRGVTSVAEALSTYNT